MHLKTVGATGNAVNWLMDTALPGEFNPSIKESKEIALEKGVLLAPVPGVGAEFAAKFLDGVSKHRVWDREVEHIAA